MASTIGGCNPQSDALDPEDGGLDRKGNSRTELLERWNASNVDRGMILFSVIASGTSVFIISFASAFSLVEERAL